MITLADITRVTLRYTFLPWYREQLAALGCPPRPDWNPTDEELERIADGLAEALGAMEDE